MCRVFHRQAPGVIFVLSICHFFIYFILYFMECSLIAVLTLQSASLRCFACQRLCVCVSRLFECLPCVSRLSECIVRVPRLSESVCFVCHACPSVSFVCHTCQSVSFACHACPSVCFACHACPSVCFVFHAGPSVCFVCYACLFFLSFFLYVFYVCFL